MAGESKGQSSVAAEERRQRFASRAQSLIGFARCGYLDLRAYQRLVTCVVDEMSAREDAEVEAAEAWARVVELEKATKGSGNGR